MSTKALPKPTDAANGGAVKAENNMSTISSNFVKKVEKQFAAEMGSEISWTPLQRTLAQHLFIKIDATIKQLNAKRADTDQITWDRINMTKLALDAVHRVSLGLDALIANHIHPIPYFNGKTKQFDLDLRVGYVGMDFCRRELAVEKPLDVAYHLVYDTDKFVPYLKSRTNEIESYDFTITNPFERGKVIGGFGYISYEDPTKNRLVLVTMRDLQRAEKAAQTQDFWAENKSRIEMMQKTVVHRTASKIPLDPAKVNAASYAYIEAQSLDLTEAEMAEEVAANANGEVLALEKGEKFEVPKGSQQEPEKVPVTQQQDQAATDPTGQQQAQF